MLPEPRRLPAEIVHCLLMDIVGYSRGSIPQQRQAAQELREVVRAAPEFQRAEAAGELLLRDTGDGLAVVFFRDPQAPSQCAIEIATAFKSRPALPVRMGIHSGPVTRDTDSANNASVYGSGINMAQRVMDCGDAGHILLSERSADDLRQFEGWADCLHELGEAEVKHGEKLRLYSLHTDTIGNAARPEKLKQAAAVKEEAVKARVALLYKRNAQPDERLLGLLETALKAAGYSVFIDRHLTIGLEWAAEIERQVRAADAVIPLLSEASLRSEMLEYEIVTAHEAASKQSGKPRLLPVRVNYAGPLPPTLAAILDPLMYFLWQTDAEDARLTGELLDTLQNPPRPKAVVDRSLLEPVGGAVPLDSKFYIPRPTDALFLEAITRRDSIVLVKGARQVGKTSLLARGLQKARESGARVIHTDFQTLNTKHLASADALLLTLATLLAGKLGLPASPRANWDPDLGANMNMDWFLETEVLSRVAEPIVWGLDEVDRLFACDFGGEFFGLVRSWHNRRALEPDGPWSRLTLAIAYATEAHLFITDLNQSPFNVGTRLILEDFTGQQIAELNSRYGAPLRDPGELARFYDLVSGHPYLVRRGLDEMVTRSLTVAELESQADRDDGIYGDHLRRLLVSLTKDEELTEVMRGLLRGGRCPSADSFYRLRSAGVIIGDSPADARLRCRFYATYLSHHL